MSIELLKQCNEAPIPEDILRNAAKELGGLLGDHDDPLNLNTMLQALLDTAHIQTLSPAHGVVACNVLCGTIEQCTQSRQKEIAELVLCTDTRQKLLEIYIDCYDTAKPKAMKQVLSTLVKLLTKSRDVLSSSEPIDLACFRCFELGLRARDRTRAKPVLHALTLFLSRSLLSTSDLFVLYGSFLGNVRNTLGQASENIAHWAGKLVSDILDWTPVGDVAPAAGQLLTAVFGDASSAARQAGGQSLPFWVQPLMKGIQARPTELEAFRCHAFPALFQSGVNDFFSFLEYLGLKQQLRIATLLPEPSRLTSEHDQISSSMRRLVLFSALQAGKANGLVQECSPHTSSNVVVHDGIVLIPDIVLARLCEKALPDARLAGLSLLISSASATRPLTTGTIKCLKRHLPHMFADVDANFRGEVHSHFQALTNRLRAILAVLARQKAKKAGGHQVTFKHDAANHNNIANPEQARTAYANHLNFITWTLKFLEGELVSTAAYQRHISALKAFTVLLRSGLDAGVSLDDLAKSARGEVRWPLHLKIMSSTLRRSLMDLLLDPFDDVRQAALEVLLIDQSSSISEDHQLSANGDHLQLERTLDKAREIMVRTGRVDQADGVARLYTLVVHNHLLSAHASSATGVVEDLVQTLEQSLDIASTDMSLAVRNHPIHGLLTALRYVLEQIFQMPKTIRDNEMRYITLFRRLEKVLATTWTCVHDLLCNDAPEGFMPEEMDDEASLTTKDVLSYAWRGLKESSLLLRTLVSPECARILPAADYDQMLQTLGNLCFTQLAELRHRGAFSTVAQTFASVCRQSGLSKDEVSGGMVQKWYTETLALIQQRGQAITRRSAGLPAIIIGLITSDDSGEMYTRAMSDLTAMSVVAPVVEDGEATDLPQVHALNSIRAIFITSRLATRSENSIVEAMHLSATCLASKIWAIRNCGLMLFRSLIDRMLGTNESADDFFDNTTGNVSRLSYDKHPGLLDLILRLLRSSNVLHAGVLPDGSDSTIPNLTAEAIFPVLDLLRRAPPPARVQLEVFDLVRIALQDDSWHVRDMAARSMAALIPHGDVSKVLQDLTALAPTIDWNEFHGRLLCIKYISKAALRLALDASDVKGDSPKTGPVSIFSLFDEHSPLLQTCVYSNADDTVTAAYVDVLNLFGTYLLASKAHQRGGTLLLGEIAHLAKFIDVSKSVCNQLGVRSRQRRGSAILRISLLKCSWITFLLSGQSTRVQSVEMSKLRILDDEDVAGAVDVLDSLQPYLVACSPETSLLLLISLLRNCEFAQSRLRSCIFSSLAVLIPSLPADGSTDHDLIITLTKIPIMKYIHDASAPSELASALSLWGYALASQWSQQGTWTGQMIGDVAKWLRLCSAGLTEDNEFPFRYAAAVSLEGLQWALAGIQQLPEKVQIEYYLSIYNALVDDDDEIRTIGARAALKIVRNAQATEEADEVVPHVAARMLCAFMTRHFSSSMTLMSAALGKLVGQQIGVTSLKPVEEILDNALLIDNSLFGEEKQNLYIDDSREAELWSRVLKHCSTGVESQQFLDKLSTWVIEGIACLMTRAQNEKDGALGWATKPDILTLGLRVILAAEVLLVWRTRSRRVKIRGSTLRLKLYELAEIGSQAELPGLWLQQIERVLRESVSKRILRVAAVLQIVEVRHDEG